MWLAIDPTSFSNRHNSCCLKNSSKIERLEIFKSWTLSIGGLHGFRFRFSRVVCVKQESRVRLQLHYCESENKKTARDLTFHSSMLSLS